MTETTETGTVNGHVLVHRDHRFLCTRCGAHRLNVDSFHAIECPRTSGDLLRGLAAALAPEVQPAPAIPTEREACVACGESADEGPVASNGDHWCGECYREATP